MVMYEVDNAVCYASVFGVRFCVVASHYGEGAYIQVELLLRNCRLQLKCDGTR